MSISVPRPVWSVWVVWDENFFTTKAGYRPYGSFRSFIAARPRIVSGVPGGNSRSFPCRAPTISLEGG